MKGQRGAVGAKGYIGDRGPPVSIDFIHLLLLKIFNMIFLIGNPRK